MSVFVVGGAAAGLTAAIAVPTVVGLGGAAAMTLGGAAVGSMLAGSRKQAPGSQSAGVQYNSESLYEKLLAQSDPKLAGQLYAREANQDYGRPAYARLEQQLMEDALIGEQHTVDEAGFVERVNYGEIPEGGRMINTEVEQYEYYVDSNPDLLEDFEASGSTDKAQYGFDHYEETGQKEGRSLPQVGSMIDAEGNNVKGETVREYVGKEYAGQKINTGGVANMIAGNQQRDFYDADGNKITRRAGFDEQGNFQGTAQLATDVAFDTQQQTVQQELGLVEEYGQRATDVIRSQGDIKNALNKVRVLDEVSANDGMSRSALDMNDAYAQPSAAQGAAGLLHERAQQMADGAGMTQNAATGKGTSFSYSTGRKKGLGSGGGGGFMGMDVVHKVANRATGKGSGESSGGFMGMDVVQKIANRATSGNYGNEVTQRTAGQGQGSANTTRGLRNSMLAEAVAGMQAGGDLTDRERRAATQSARAAMSARGRLMDFGGIMAEMEMNEELRQKRRQERYNFAGQVMNTEQGLMDRQTARDALFQSGLAQDRQNAANRVGLEMDTSADAFKAILNKDSGAGLAQGTQLYAGAGSAKTASPNLYNPHTGLQFEQQQAVNQDNYNAATYAADTRANTGRTQGLLNAAATIYQNS